MENEFIIHHLKNVAYAVTLIEQQNNSIKNSICVLLGYLKADTDFRSETEDRTLTTEYSIDPEKSDILEFNQKEISKMPKQFKTLFKTNGVRAHVRKRIRNNSISYEIRFRADGYNISASGVTLEEAKARFIRKLEDYRNGIKPAAPDVPKTFDKFITYYFEKFRIRKVGADTYKKDQWRIKKYILPYFKNILLKDITPQFCQQLIDQLSNAGKGRTAEEIFSLLNCTFKIAVKHNLIQHNPMDIVVHDKHEREHGKALTLAEEWQLLHTAQEPHLTIFAIAIYTGLRPNEYETVKIVGNMIYARNSKRKDGKEEIKRIPITPMLKSYINDKTIMPILGIQGIRNNFKKILKNHKLYDLRTTFYTRCKMCGISSAARAAFMGHTTTKEETGPHNDYKLDKAYTDLPDEYLIKEGQKLDYELSAPNLPPNLII